MKRLKRMIPVLLLTLCLLCLLPGMDLDAAAADTTGKCGNNITWTYANGVLTLTGSGEMYNYNNTDNRMPWNAYALQIKAVTADPAITRIGNYGLYHCVLLETVNLPGVVSVGHSAFECCNSLQTLSMPALASIEDHGFLSCVKLQTVNLPNVVSVGANAFAQAPITELNLPNVRYIGANSFDHCKALVSANLPILETIGSAAFSHCNHLTQISAPKVTLAEQSAFYNCAVLTKADLPALTTLGDYGFYGCEALAAVSFPKLTALGTGAFSYCKALTNVDLPKVAIVKRDAFLDCEALSTLQLPALTTLESGAFVGCDSLTSVSLPVLTAVPDRAFAERGTLRSVDLPKVSSIGSYAFAGTGLSGIYFPALTTLHEYAFSGCSLLTEVNLPVLTKLPTGAFDGCWGLTAVNAPLLTEIGDFAFRNCSALPIIDLPYATFIGNCAFYCCTKLTEAYIPAVQTIDYNGFNNCKSLALLSISTQLQEVRARSFEACSALKQVFVSITQDNWAPKIDGYNNEYFLMAEAIFDKPPFSLDPMPDYITATKGFNAALSVTAHGSGCSYQWQMCLPERDVWTDISPAYCPTAKSAKLFFGPVTMDDTGTRFRCVVTNRYGDTLTSEEVVMKVSPFEDVDAGAYYFTPVLWAVDNGITTGTFPTAFSPEGPCTRGQVVTFLWRAEGKPTPTTTAMPFTDVAADAYYYNAVLWAVEQGITTGTSETTFSPDATCTRGQIATLLWRAAGSPIMHAFEIPTLPEVPETPELPEVPDEGNTTEPDEIALTLGENETERDEAEEQPQVPVIPSKSPFADVQPLDYFYQAVLWAAEEDITTGTSATAFSPNDPCTRAQIVTFLYRDAHN